MIMEIQAKNFDGVVCQVSVDDVLFGDFFIDTQRADGLFSPVSFFDDAAMDAYFADLDDEAWDRECKEMNRYC